MIFVDDAIAGEDVAQVFCWLRRTQQQTRGCRQPREATSRTLDVLTCFRYRHTAGKQYRCSDITLHSNECYSVFVHATAF